MTLSGSHLQTFAAYGDNAYGSSAYNHTQTQTTEQSILAPLTGFIREQPPYVLGGAIIFIVICTLLLVKFWLSSRKRRAHL